MDAGPRSTVQNSVFRPGRSATKSRSEKDSRVAVIGGGISGLATAYFLATANAAIRPTVTVVESDRRLGGKVLTVPFADHDVDAGPDAYLARSPAIHGLIDALDLTDAVVAPGSTHSFVLSRGRLRRLPAGTSFGVPKRLLPLLRSGLVSPLGVARAGMDLVLPRLTITEDPSVRQLLRPRFGTEVYDRLIEPLLGGVYAGRAHLLSAGSTVPEIEALARQGRSVYLGLRRRANRAPARPASGEPGPMLTSLSGGLGSLIDRMASAIPAVEFRTGTTVTSLDRTPAGFRLLLATGDHGGTGATETSNCVNADAVVVATPAFDAATLLEPLAPTAATALREVPYANVAIVIMEYPRAAIGHPLTGTGFLVPPVEGRLVVGCTWLSTKWPHLADPTRVLIRCAVGRHGDDRWRGMDDDSLALAVHRELAAVLGLSQRPHAVHVRRWPNGLPQYTVGHADRLGRISAALASVPGLWVTGAAYRGVGLAGCVTQARQVAQTALDHLAEHDRHQRTVHSQST